MTEKPEKPLVGKGVLGEIQGQLDDVNAALKRYEGLQAKKKRLEWSLALLRGEEIDIGPTINPHPPQLPPPAAPAQAALPFSEEDWEKAMNGDDDEPPRVVGSSEAKHLGVRARIRDDETPRSRAGVKTVLDVILDYFEAHPNTTRTDALEWMRANVKSDFTSSHLDSAITKLKDRGFLARKDDKGKILYRVVKREPSHSLILGEHYDKILEWIRTHPGVRLNEIAKGTELSVRSLENYIASMRKLGKIRVDGVRPYRYFHADAADEEEEEEALSAPEKQTLGYIQSHPGSHQYEIAEALGAHKTSVSRRVAKLVAEKKIRKQGFQYYAVDTAPQTVGPVGPPPSRKPPSAPGTKGAPPPPGQLSVLEMMFACLDASPEGGATGQTIQEYVMSRRPTATEGSVYTQLRDAVVKGYLREQGEGDSRKYFIKKRVESRSTQLWKVWKLILDYVREHPGSKNGEIAEALKLEANATVHATQGMRARDWIRAEGTRPYAYYLGPKAPEGSE